MLKHFDSRGCSCMGVVFVRVPQKCEMKRVQISEDSVGDIVKIAFIVGSSSG